MSTAVVALVEVEWYAIEKSDQLGGGYPYYRHCDVCEGGADDDAMAGKRVSEFRHFWQEMPVAATGGLIVCEHCLDEYLAVKP